MSIDIDFDRNVHCLLGLPLDAVDMAGTLQQVRGAVSDGRHCFLSTPNLNFLIGSQSDAAFRSSVIHSNLSVADGMPLVWMARLLGIPIRERVAGASLFEALAADAEKPLTVFFFGGSEGVAEQASRRLNAQGQGLSCVGFHYPGFGSVDEMSTDEIIDRINASGADLLVVSLGARKGQAWIERNRSRIVIPVISHLGAVVNFAAVTISRAPRWMQAAGLEWLWRIKAEPGLWSRDLKDGLMLIWLFLTKVIPLALHMRRQPVVGEATRLVVDQDEWGSQIILRPRGICVAQTLAPLREAIAAAATAGAEITLDLAGVKHADSAFVGLMVLLQGYQSSTGRRAIISGAPRRVKRVFGWSCAAFVFDQKPHGAVVQPRDAVWRPAEPAYASFSTVSPQTTS